MFQPTALPSVRTQALLHAAGRPRGVGPAFADVAETFRKHGGLWDGDELAGALRPCIDQPVSCIARMIASRRMLSLGQNVRIFVPQFQFSDRLTVRPDVGRVIAELVDVLDDHELATWFATDNAWLGGAKPVAMIAIDPDAVHATARADRYVATGG